MSLAYAIRQGSPEWVEARKSLITATDIPVLLGLSPYKCEADLADEKRGLTEVQATTRMRMGLALEDLIAAEYEAVTGHKTRRWTSLAIHRDLEWAAASPDRKRKGALVELKWSGSKSRFADGLPQDFEAQVSWQLGVTGYRHADVAVLAGDELLPVFEVDFDAALFDDLVAVATDFRRRLAEGGPFSRDLNRIRRDHPADDGSELLADDELTEAAHALAMTRTQIAGLEALEARLKTAIQDRMGVASVLIGPDFRATWKKTKDREETDWKSLAQGLLRTLPETEREALVGIHSSVRPGMRPFRLLMEGQE